MESQRKKNDTYLSLILSNVTGKSKIAKLGIL